jgi:CubicO group peptidase (beta-lactamase class C family)
MFGSVTSSLPRSTPSAQGVDPSGVLAFLDAVASRDMDLHSLMVIRHGHVVSEGWWAPYRPDRVHLLYSLSKSFTSTAIGIAVGEGLLTVEDRIVDLFPDKVPAQVDPFTAAMKVKDILAMASGHAEDTISRLNSGGDDVVKTFLSIPPDQAPGTLFCYNQGCTYTLSAIITKLTGLHLIDYLRPRLLDPLGIGEAYWSQLGGLDQGYSGFHVATEAIAKLGLLHLQGGMWEGRQLVPADYIAAAHIKHSDNSEAQDNPDWQQGYGYQFWVSRHDAYRGDGAFGQFCVVIPGADAVVACTAREADMQAELDLIWEHLLPAVSGDAPADAGAEQELSKRLADLVVRPVDAGLEGPAEAVTFTPAGAGTDDDVLPGLTAVRVEPGEKAVTVTLTVGGADHSFALHPGEWTEGEVPELHLHLANLAISGGWISPDEFAATLIALHAPHRLEMKGHAGAAPTLELSWSPASPLQQSGLSEARPG